MDVRFVKGFVSGLLLAACFVALAFVLVLSLLPATRIVEAYQVAGLTGAMYRIRHFRTPNPVCLVTDEERESFLRLDPHLRDKLNGLRNSSDDKPYCKEVRKLLDGQASGEAFQLLTKAAPSEYDPKWVTRAENYLVAQYLNKVVNLRSDPETAHIVEVWERCERLGQDAWAANGGHYDPDLHAPEADARAEQAESTAFEKCMDAERQRPKP
jgi:hypothetical protein